MAARSSWYCRTEARRAYIDRMDNHMNHNSNEEPKRLGVV